MDTVRSFKVVFYFQKDMQVQERTKNIGNKFKMDIGLKMKQTNFLYKCENTRNIFDRKDWEIEEFLQIQKIYNRMCEMACRKKKCESTRLNKIIEVFLIHQYIYKLGLT